MKILGLPKFAAIFAATPCSVFAQNTVLNSWDFSKATGGAGYASVPPLVGDLALNFQNGTSVEDDPNEGRTVIKLDGTQTEPVRTNRNLAPLDSIHTRIRFKPSLSGGPLQTIVALGGIYELRYNREHSSLEFIVNNPTDKKYFIIRAEVSSAVGNQAVAPLRTVNLRSPSGSRAPTAPSLPT